MQLRYDDDFLEAAVFLCCSGVRAGVPSIQVRRFHAERDRCYTILDPDERSAAFFRVHLEWFREWDLEKTLLAPIRGDPLIEKALNLLAFRQARGKNDEGAELYVRNYEGERNAVLALRVRRFENDDKLSAFLRHEFMHLHDMVDPAFGYSPFVKQTGPSPTQQRITRERYRLLWDVTIDGRLSRQTHSSLEAPRAKYEALFHRAYSFWPEEKRQTVFEQLWNSCAPKHSDLLALASDPRDFAHAHEPVPGAPCPLCTFPTFEWADPSSFTPEATTAIQAQFPSWRPQHGTCSRCLETYEVALGLPLG